MNVQTPSIFATLVALLAAPLAAGTPRVHRAVLIGINDYSASDLHARHDQYVPKRDWTQLDGAVNDVRLMRDILIARYDFAPGDIVTLTDQQATRTAILTAIENQLLRQAKRDDVLLFYYSGHGSQVRNSLSSEPDKMDESLVPADSRLGAKDIRDKELSVVFNRIVDTGARLTVVLDACHSGSGARGLSGGLQHRSITADLRDVADSIAVPAPEDRGALVIAAAEDFDWAYETLGDHQIRGAFSWAFARALRDASANEPASDTFLRAAACLSAESPAQNPVLAGRADVRQLAFLGNRNAVGSPGRAIAIQGVATDGTYTLVGGWVQGLTVGTRLRTSRPDSVELEVTSLVGAGHAVARTVESRPERGGHDESLKSGTLLRISTWAAPPVRPLRVWIPRGSENAISIGRKIARSALARGTQCIDDPTETSPAEVTRWHRDRWETLSVANGTTLFVQFPATSSVADAAHGVGGVEVLDGPATADYILTGRLTPHTLEYAWVRPGVSTSYMSKSAMPVRSAWYESNDDAALNLRTALLQLVRLHGWHELQSPSGSAWSYHLAIYDPSDRKMIAHGPLFGTHHYEPALRLDEARRAPSLYARYVYVFVIDSRGQSILLFPRPESGSVENRLPLIETASLPIDRPPPEIRLGERAAFVIAPPYGIDSYFLLTTDSPLSNISCLEWGGVRAPATPVSNPLETLLAQTAAGRGQETVRTSPNWFVEKIAFESVPPK